MPVCIRNSLHKILSLVENHPVFPKKVCKNLLHLPKINKTNKMVIGTITCIFYLLFVYHVYFCIAVGDTITKKETLEITCSGLTYLFDMDFYNHIRWWCCVYNALRCWISLFELSFYCCFVCSDLRWEAIFVECRCLRFLFIISQRSYPQYTYHIKLMLNRYVEF